MVFLLWYSHYHSKDLNYKVLTSNKLITKTYSDINLKIITPNETLNISQNLSRRDNHIKLRIGVPTSLIFLLKVTKLTSQVYCMNETEAIIAPGVYAWIHTSTEKINSPHQDALYGAFNYHAEIWRGNSVVARFRTPDLKYEELVNMGRKLRWLELPNQRMAKVLDEFHKKYWGLATNEILERLKKYGDDIMYKHHGFIFTGHGSGAVLATFTALIFNQFWPTRNVKLVTYGAPRIGNKGFVKFIQEKIWVERVTVGNDHVPLFFGNGYLTHPSGETWISPNINCDCFDSGENKVPDTYRCLGYDGVENKQCNLQFEKPKGQLPEKAEKAHIGPYFRYFMSRQGCNV
ncbi:hypothetical protein G9A89_000144 [Geosiphon pyriformis]|nr:hypothetical protein G9A89_000144 [Geosiphon pyriformis]